jgi:type II secretory pathway pseudopilin PulG
MTPFYLNHRSRPGRAPRGFTLIEAAIVTVIVGVGIVAMMELMAAGTMANTQATELSTAMCLASNIHERSMCLAYTDLFSTLDNRTYTPPVDANGNGISELSGWQQAVDVSYVDPNCITLTVPDAQTEPTARITVTVSHNNQTVYTMSWIAAASQWPPP